MSFFKDLVDSLGSILSTTYSDSSTPPNGSHAEPSSPNSAAMEAGAGARPTASISNERVAYKLKGYFDLAKEEIDKAVRAEEWGILDDAIAHYTNAHSILLEASSTPTPSFITARFWKISRRNSLSFAVLGFNRSPLILRQF